VTSEGFAGWQGSVGCDVSSGKSFILQRFTDEDKVRHDNFLVTPSGLMLGMPQLPLK
jgi:hypothetical protein